ncbi:hypothetical protein BV25DRAFT_1900543 [Artomyces pyxidatus]|uniref:Uncharacterized protein n=1 Tax=Artomyces pyxidatus TaxID=48021 RepID=A0ACB8SYN4_9AGAM|nr:hypothetical protein BV25DRAFT_1900543 [Artomyces pyxidatus]
MPVTRSQSRMDSGRPAFPAKRKDGWNITMKGDLGTGEAASDSSIDDCEGEAHDVYLEARSKPVTKRRRLDKPETKTDGSMTAPQEREITWQAQSGLQNLLSVPLDVLFETYSLLTPADLLNLARTSKKLRTVLMSRTFVLVWRAARTQVHGLAAPSPPDDMSEPAWAQLLYGGAVCSECGKSSSLKIEFALRRRLCATCMRRCLVCSSSWKVQCRGFDPSVMKFLPYTTTGEWAFGNPPDGKFYMKQDVIAMTAKLAGLAQDKAAFRKFCIKRILFVDDVMQESAVYEKWLVDAAQSRMTMRYEDIVRRLLDAGHEEVDILNSPIMAQPGAYSEQKLTDQAWKFIQEKMKEVVMETRAWRRKSIVSHRNFLAGNHYLAFRELILPAQWAYLPVVSQAETLSCFKKLIDQEEEPSPADWTSAVQKLPQSLSDWMESNKQRYCAMMPAIHSTTSLANPTMEIALLSDPCIDIIRREKMASFAGPLELAQSVFTAANVNRRRAFFGPDICQTWQKPDTLVFSARGAIAALAIVEALRLDAYSTTATTLDQLQARFVCMTCCKEEKYVGYQSAYSWRLYVEHYMQSESDHPVPEWHILNPEQTYDVIRREDNPKHYPHRSWCCNHCTQYHPGGSGGSGPSPDRNRAGIIDHLRTVHDIADPVDDVDLFYLSTIVGRRCLAEPVIVNQDFAALLTDKRLHCGHCRTGGEGQRTRLFTMSSLKSHIKDKHKIVRILEPGQDFY